MEPQALGRQGLGLGDAGHLGRDLQLLVVLAVLLVVLGVGDALDDLAGDRIGVADAAGGILGVRRTHREVILGIAPVPALHGEGRGPGLVGRLVKEHQDVVGGLEGDSGVVAELGQKPDVAHLVLLHPLIEGV